MTEEERQAVKELNDAVQVKKIAFFGLLETLDKADETTLMHMGCKGKTQGEAMQIFYRSIKKDIDNLYKAHVRKYPD